MENYEKVRLVGRGAFGTVYLCKQLSDKKLVILKEIPVDQMSVEERQASMNEAKVLAMLDHPNVVAYYDSFLEDKILTIVMEYVQGGTLYDFLQERGDKYLSEEEILQYFGQMVYTLQHVHEKLILHRDLKSQNILINESKNVIKIGDFGISKVLSSKSKAYTKSDIWALGCLLYELMTLRRPFDATTLPALIMKIMKGTFDPVPDMYSLKLKQLLSSMLHLDPDQRPSASQILCHPALIKVIFRLYLDIGSIPLSKISQSFNLKVPDRPCVIESSLRRKSSDSFENQVQIWLFDTVHRDPLLLPRPPRDTVLFVSAGFNHQIGLSKSGQLICWKTCPELMISKNSESCESILPSLNFAFIVDEKLSLNIVSVVCGNDFTLCLSDKGVVYSFGKSSSGCLGFSTERDVEQPKIIEALFGHHIRSIACSPEHALVLTEENELFTWGHGNLGCLGLGSTEFQLLPKKVLIKNEIGIKNIFCGVECSFLILENYSVMACGSNRHNKLAMDTVEGYQTEVVRKFVEIPSESLPELRIVSVSSGKAHSAFLTDKNEVYTVGSNRYSQLGWGDTGIDYSMPQRVEKLKHVKVSEVKCGSLFTVAVSRDRYFFCWGKCPDSLAGGYCSSPLCDVHVPVSFKNKSVHSVCCSMESCIVIGEERD